MPDPVPFPFAPDWSVSPRERLSWLTDVLSLEQSSEQRIALRSIPRRTLRYKLLHLEPRESAAFRAFLWAEGASVLTVPFWPDRLALLTDVSISDTLIPVSDTSSTLFRAGGEALLWRDAFTFELLAIESVAPDSILSSAQLAMDWPADGRSFIIPALRGRFPAEISSARVLPYIEEMQEAIFELEEEPINESS